MLVVLLLCLFVSCVDNPSRLDSESNKGTYTFNTVAGKNTLTITFIGSDNSRKVMEGTTSVAIQDTGRFDTIIEAFEDNGLDFGREYRASVAGTSIYSLIADKDNGSVTFYDAKGKELGRVYHAFTLSPYLKNPFTLSITYGGENIQIFDDLPISPIGLASGTLWNDHGVIRIVP